MIEMLEAARRLAADGDEWQVVRLLQDSLDYAEGKVLRYDFEERYRLFQDGERSESKRDFVARMIEDVREVARRLVAKPEALLALAAGEDGMLLLRAAELQQRTGKLREMRRIVEEVAASEYDLQQAFQAHPWIFGGQFINTAARRSLAVGTEVDIPLLRADGSLHIVELK